MPQRSSTKRSSSKRSSSKRPSKKRINPTVNALREIKLYAKQQKPFLQVRPFRRAIKYMMQHDRKKDKRLRFEESSLIILQEAAESYLVGVFEDANKLAIHDKRITIQEKDLQLAESIRCKLK